MAEPAAAVEFLGSAWASAVRDLVSVWPDAVELADERKPESYWAYYKRKCESFDGAFALGVRDAPGRGGGTAYVTLSFEGGSCTDVAVLPEAEGRAKAKLALECRYGDWLDIVRGYDIGKSMTYHKLPQVVGGSDELLRVIYFVHELLVAMSRVEAAYPEPASVG